MGEDNINKLIRLARRQINIKNKLVENLQPEIATRIASLSTTDKIGLYSGLSNDYYSGMNNIVKITRGKR